MVSPRLRSRRLRRVKKRVVTGTVTHYVQRNRNIERCAVCKQKLRGIPRLTNRAFKKLNKTQKTIERPYGGYMCHQCLQQKLVTEFIDNV